MFFSLAHTPTVWIAASTFYFHECSYNKWLIFDRISSDPHERIVVTHGTDTMDLTGRKLKGITGKVIVLTGAMQPANFKYSDAEFNIGFAVAAVQTLPHGVYLAMNGRIFLPGKVKKNSELNRFEQV